MTKKYNIDSRIEHPFKLVFAEGNPKFLVIGSFPPTASKMSFNFFYPNGNNNFWKVLQKVFPKSKTVLDLNVSIKNSMIQKEKNELDRKEFCRENEIAITDMLASCIRLDGNSKDEKLLVQSYSPILTILQKHTTIKRIILTGKSSGSSAHHHFYQYLSMNAKDFELDTEGEIYQGKISVEDREIIIFSLNSTSSRSPKAKSDNLIELYKQAFDQ